MSTKPGLMDFKDQLSITQLEVLKAVEQLIPVYVFVDEKVLHDHRVYEKNKGKEDVIGHIEFPSIPKRETAKYIFEFINFLSHRNTNNSIVSFTRLDDIRGHLAVQWSQLFQRLLFESRTRNQEGRRYSDFAERIEDLKAVVLASLATPDLRDTAKGALQFRRLISFVSALELADHRNVLLSDCDWKQVLEAAQIVQVRAFESDRMGRSESLLIRADGTFYRSRYQERIIHEFGIDWSNFKNLDRPAREAIADALLEDRESRGMMSMLFYVNENVDDYLAHRQSAASSTINIENGSTTMQPVVPPAASNDGLKATIS